MNQVSKALVEPATIEHETDDPRKDIVTTARREMTPMEMVGRALEMGVSADILKQMMDLRDREEARNAKLAFAESFAAFKSEAVTIVRNKKVTDGPLKGKSYAELFSFVDAVTPALSAHGLSASWNITRDEEKWIEVTCTIEHVLGHTKSVAMGGPPDVGGAKNPIQARASTVTYLERHTLKAVTGFAEQGDDNDGKSGPAKSDEKINDAQLIRLRALLEETGSDTAKFCELGKLDALPDMLAADFDDAVRLLETKKRKMAS